MGGIVKVHAPRFHRIVLWAATRGLPGFGEDAKCLPLWISTSNITPYTV